MGIPEFVQKKEAGERGQSKQAHTFQRAPVCDLTLGAIPRLELRVAAGRPAGFHPALRLHGARRRRPGLSEG